MKRYIYFLFLFIVFKSNASVPDSIPNAGFETWYITQWFEIPGDWMTNNSQILPPTVLKDSLKRSGNFAMRLTNTGSLQPFAGTGFPITSHHNNLSFYANPWLNNNDSGYVKVRLFYNSVPVDSGDVSIFTGIVGGYTLIVVPISQTFSMADSCEISLWGGNDSGSTVLFDDMSFDFGLGMDKLNKSQLNAYPNPCHTFLNVTAPDNFVPEEIDAYNIKGQHVKLDLNQNGSKTIFNVSALPAGSWIIYAKRNDFTYSTVILKE